MEFERTEDQALLVDSARRIVETEIKPILDRNPQDRPLPKAEMLKIFAVFSREGLTAPRLPVEAGGSGMKMLDYGMVYEQLPPVVAISLLSHEVTITRIHAESTEEQRERFLPDAIAGRKICCTGSTEPDTGSDPRGIKTRLTERDGKLFFTADSDAVITKGLISLLIKVLSGHTPKEIIDSNITFIDVIGLSSHLSPTRSNGLLSMVKQIRLYALAFQAKSIKS